MSQSKCILKCKLVLLFSLLFWIISLNPSNAQNINAEQLIKASINYHDPELNWKTFKDTLIVEMTTPNQTPRVSKVHINNLNNDFYLKVEKDGNNFSYNIASNKCDMTLNGNSNFNESDAKKFNLNCDRGNMLKNYYTYLYGMPMKILDPGAIISNKVERKSFHGKDYLVIIVSYSPEVGSDIWFFYFNPKNYALEAYQFFKSDDNGKIITDTGEYILFEGETIINDIKLPKIRKWYYNKNNQYLGTDTLTN
ncbi:hypothetical protein FJ651_03135 [Paucihalobacter ruber]|uniref:Aspartyl-tRNA synthetase n=1 Tax=Paucihalobacter ruber TaxID=2567861 RepID=A0A506PRL2_9FLAO|nr:DUF6503 family protein [Paucihalobacter ruber]TPV35927.1 hypothetical protein FJ651_03135 [Paucihalobacter ruber]